jgi:hypothetical protein
VVERKECGKSGEKKDIRRRGLGDRARLGSDVNEGDERMR